MATAAHSAFAAVLTPELEYLGGTPPALCPASRTVQPVFHTTSPDAADAWPPPGKYSCRTGLRATVLQHVHERDSLRKIARAHR
jgi:hypothetical protein